MDLHDLMKMASSQFPDSGKIKKEAEKVKTTKDAEGLVALNTETKVKSRLEYGLKDKTGIERILGRNNLVDINTLQKGLDLSTAVCRIIQMHGEDIIPVASGFLVAPKLVLTNNHVIGEDWQARRYFAEFDFEKDDKGKVKPTHKFKFAPEVFFVTDEDLDYTLIALEPVATNNPDKSLSDFKFAPLSPVKGRLLKGEAISIIQHPPGKPKKIAMRASQIFDLEQDPFLLYTTDTEPGSSGSLVCNDDWHVIALHSRGVPDMNENGQILLTDGRIWEYEEDKDQIKWIANRGTLIDAILDDLFRRELEDKKMNAIKAGFLKGYQPDTGEEAYQLPL